MWPVFFPLYKAEISALIFWLEFFPTERSEISDLLWKTIHHFSSICSKSWRKLVVAFVKTPKFSPAARQKHKKNVISGNTEIFPLYWNRLRNTGCDLREDGWFSGMRPNSVPWWGSLYQFRRHKHWSYFCTADEFRRTEARKPQPLFQNGSHPR